MANTFSSGDASMAKNKSVFGIYLTRSDVESAVTAFKDAGFSSSDISVLLPENLGFKDLVTDKSTKAPEGAAVGAGSGAAIGGALGWLVGAGALAIPGIGPVIAAGPIVAALAGIGVGGALGGFAGVLIGVGIPEYEAKRYEGRILKGGILVGSIARHPRKSSAPKESWKSPALRTLHLPVKLRPTKEALPELSAASQNAETPGPSTLEGPEH
jgi:hypothetical protein